MYSYFGDQESILDFSDIRSTEIKTYYNKKYAKVLKSILFGLGISFVHVHHMIDHYFDIVDLCKENNIKWQLHFMIFIVYVLQ